MECRNCSHLHIDEFSQCWCDLIEKGDVPWDVEEYGDDEPDECPRYEEGWPERI